MTLCACFVLPMKACAARIASQAPNFLGVFGFLGVRGRNFVQYSGRERRLCGGYGETDCARSDRGRRGRDKRREEGCMCT